MLLYKTYIEELLNLDSELTVNQIQLWLKKYRDECLKAVDFTECRKWARYLRTGERPFPCVCETRVEECIFIELYIELNNALKLILQDEVYKKVLEHYEGIKYNNKAVFEWVKDNEELGKNLFFDGTVSVTINSEPYKKIELSLDKSECEHLHKFREVFKNHYYSKEYKDY
jgi:hypothetical protein